MYFFLSLFIPFLTYLIPYYKITKVNLYKKKYSLAINIVVSLILYVISPSFLIYYLIFPYTMEFTFYLFNKLTRRIQVYNRIVVMSIIPTILIFIYIYINRVEIIRIINLLPQLEEFKKLGVEYIRRFQETMIYISQNIVSQVFKYVFLATFFLFCLVTLDALKNCGTHARKVKNNLNNNGATHEVTNLQAKCGYRGNKSVAKYVSCDDDSLWNTGAASSADVVLIQLLDHCGTNNTSHLTRHWNRKRKCRHNHTSKVSTRINQRIRKSS